MSGHHVQKDTPLSSVELPISMRSSQDSLITTTSTAPTEERHTPMSPAVELPRAPVAPMLPPITPVSETASPSSHPSVLKQLKCVGQCKRLKPEAEFLTDEKIFKTCAPCREIDQRRRRAQRQRKALAGDNTVDISDGGITGKAHTTTADAMDPQAEPSSEMKTCTAKCGLTKPLTDFYRLDKRKLGATYRSDWKRCNECHAAEIHYRATVHARKQAELLSAAPPIATNDGPPASTPAPAQSPRHVTEPLPASKVKFEPKEIDIDLTEDTDIEPEVKTETEKENNPLTNRDVEMSDEDEMEELRRLALRKEIATIELQMMDEAAKMKKKRKERSRL